MTLLQFKRPVRSETNIEDLWNEQEMLMKKIAPDVDRLEELRILIMRHFGGA